MPQNGNRSISEAARNFDKAESLDSGGNNSRVRLPTNPVFVYRPDIGGQVQEQPRGGKEKEPFRIENVDVGGSRQPKQSQVCHSCVPLSGLTHTCQP